MKRKEVGVRIIKLKDKASFLFLFFICFFIADDVKAQADTLVIVDAHTKSPIPLASVKIEFRSGRTVHSKSNKGGFVPLAGMRDSIRTIEVRHVGYIPLLRTGELLHSSNVLNLFSDATEIEEVHVISTGYQKLPQDRLTGSFGYISEKDLARYPTRNVLSRLDMLTTGVQFDKRFGENSIEGINIRGRGTIYGDAAPLIVLDDFPYEGSLDNLDPTNIESITLLKDAAASSIWGVRASNGVLVITTKSGKRTDKINITAQSHLRLTSSPNLQRLQWMTTPDFIEVERTLFANGYFVGRENDPNRSLLSPVVELLIANREGQLTDSALEKIIGEYGNRDVRKDMERYLYRPGMGQQTNMSLSGGTEKSTYWLNVAWDRDRSSLAALSDRYSMNTRNSFVLFDKLHADVRLSFTHQDNRVGGLGYSDINLGGAKRIYPYAQLKDEDGENATVYRGYRDSFIHDAMGKGLLDWRYNPLNENDLINSRSHRNEPSGNISLRYELFPGFDIEGRYQISGLLDARHNLRDVDSYFVRDYINQFTQQEADGNLTRPVPIGDILDRTEGKSWRQYWRGQASYKISAEDHNLVWLGGMERRAVKNTSSSFRVYGYDDDVLTYSLIDYSSLYRLYHNNNFRNRISDGVAFSAGTNRFVSYYSNLGYTYRKRYTLSASVRKDGSNLFGVDTNRKFVPLWSVGVSYDLAREPYFKVDWVDDLKTRFTFGYSGNLDNTLSSLPTMRYSTSQTYYPDLPYGVLVNPSNPHLRWEKTRTINAGIDFRLKGGIGGSVDYYHKNGQDLIGDTPLDPTTGVQGTGLSYGTYSYRGNIAEMFNRGVDLNLSGNWNIGTWSWQHIFNLSYNKSEIISYSERTNLNGSFYVGHGTQINPIVGKPVYSVYSYRFNGLDTEGNPMGWHGDAESVDYSAILTSTDVSDLVYHGPAVAPWYGNYRVGVTRGALSVSAALAFKFGFYYRTESIHYANLFDNWSGHSDYSMRWQKPGDEHFTHVPSLIYPQNRNRDTFYGNSEVLVRSGDFIRLNDIRIDYSFLRNRMNCFVMAENLGFIWKKSKGTVNPETLSELAVPFVLSTGIKFNL